MQQKRLFYISCAGYFISSASILLMGFGDISGKQGSVVIAIISAVVFWLSLLIAVTAHILLHRIQKPYRQKQALIIRALSPPTWFFELLFLIAFTVFIIITALNINSFIFYPCLFLMLLGFEMTILTGGRFRNKDGKIILKIYRIPFDKKENII